MVRKVEHTSINRKVLQGERTRGEILTVARKLFGEKGYANTTIEDLLKAAKITRGALYHHFRDKQDLFRAVYQDLMRDAFIRVVTAASKEGDIWLRLKRGRAAFLDSWTDPPSSRIVLIDGPSVLSSNERQRIQSKLEQEYAGGPLIRRSLDALASAGEIAPASWDALQTVLSGAYDAAALAIARAPDRARARREIGAALDWIIDALRKAAEPPKRDT